MREVADSGSDIRQFFPDHRFFNFSSFLGDHILALLSKANVQIQYVEPYLEIASDHEPVFQFGQSMRPLAYPRQVHSDRIMLADHSGVYLESDGIITANPELMIRIKVADCVPVFVHDPENRLKALIHSGWRGTINRITTKGLTRLIELGSRMNDIKIVLGPSIKKKNYIVQDDVAKHFRNKNKEKSVMGWNIDMIGEIEDDLISMGVRSDQIFSPDICSYKSNECHSFRRDGNNSGRMYAYMGDV